MKNKFIIVLYFFVLISQIYCVNPPKCITTKNVYKDGQVFIDGNGAAIEKNVEWWVLEQLKQCKGAIYTDNTLKGGNSEINELHNYNIRDYRKPNPITSTYQQSLPNNSGDIIFNSLTYNDDHSNNNDSAHAKGFFIWNEEGGIHVIHSVPKSPEIGYEPLFNKKENENNQHAQHSICITLSKEELYIIPKYIIYSNLNIQTINTVSPNSGSKGLSSAKSYSEYLKNEIEKISPGVIQTDVIKENDLPNEAPKTFNELDGLMKKHIFNGNTNLWDGVIYLNKWSQLTKLILNKDITSSDLVANPQETNVHYNIIYDAPNKGRYFIQTTNGLLYKTYEKKNEDVHKDKIKFFLVWHYISSKNDKNFKTMVHTQTKVKTKKDTISQSVESIYLSYRFETPWAAVTSADTSVDHSKMSYQFNNAKSGGGGGTICFGDLNWHGRQEARGGGAFCSDEMNYLSEYFYRRVGIIRHPVEDKFNDKVSLRLNSIAGQKLNLNELTKQYPGVLTKLLKKRILDFETKVKGYGDDEKYYHLNPYNIVYNKEDDKLFSNNYNFGYDNVYIPLLTQLKDQTIPDEYKSELFDFNVFPSIKGEIILCDDNDVDTCNFEKSKSYQLFKGIYIESKVSVNLVGSHPVIDTVNTNVVEPIVTTFLNTLYIDLKTVNFVKQIYDKLGFTKNENIIQLKEVNIDLEPFKLSQDEKNKKICKAYPNDANSKIIKYLPGCQDLLIYCILLTENKHGVLGDIDSNQKIINALGKYTKNIKTYGASIKKQQKQKQQQQQQQQKKQQLKFFRYFIF
ncbi:hypothetical protein ACTFIY_000544 [Dictyostelium cf. discoideum]